MWGWGDWGWAPSGAGACRWPGKSLGLGAGAGCGELRVCARHVAVCAQDSSLTPPPARGSGAGAWEQLAAGAAFGVSPALSPRREVGGGPGPPHLEQRHQGPAAVGVAQWHRPSCHSAPGSLPLRRVPNAQLGAERRTPLSWLPGLRDPRPAARCGAGAYEPCCPLRPSCYTRTACPSTRRCPSAIPAWFRYPLPICVCVRICAPPAVTGQAREPGAPRGNSKGRL